MGTDVRGDWRVQSHEDFSGNNAEFEFAIVRYVEDSYSCINPGKDKIVLFNQTCGIKPTRANLNKMKKVTNETCKFFNKMNVKFEE